MPDLDISVQTSSPYQVYIVWKLVKHIVGMVKLSFTKIFPTLMIYISNKLTERSLIFLYRAYSIEFNKDPKPITLFNVHFMWLCFLQKREERYNNCLQKKLTPTQFSFPLLFHFMRYFNRDYYTVSTADDVLLHSFCWYKNVVFIFCVLMFFYPKFWIYLLPCFCSERENHRIILRQFPFKEGYYSCINI